jgi:acyl-CoA hydrolase
MNSPHAAPVILDTVEAAVDALIARLGKDIRIGLPLGLGKPIELVNALYARAKADPTLSLTILTALSLERPVPGSALEARFLQPFIDRVFGDCPDLAYMLDLRANRLPANVQIKEFFFKPGSNLGNAHAQQHYISTNYSFAARDVFNQGCNVAAQIVCKRETPEGNRYSLSCNPDTSPELIELLRQSGRPHAVVGLVNQNLPFMARDAEHGPELFHFLVDHPRYTTTLFSTPKMAVTTPDYAIGLYAASLVRDGGTLQIGIGALGDAIVHVLQARQASNALFREAAQGLGVIDEYGALIERCGGLAPFEQGLYAATEMFVDGFWQLLKSGILKRKVYDHWALQQLVNEGLCQPEQLGPALLDQLAALGVGKLEQAEFALLQRHGVFTDALRWQQAELLLPDGSRVPADLGDAAIRQRIASQGLGRALRDGVVLHGGFFLGPRDFYQGLHDMSEAERREICMIGVNKVNQLDLNPRLYRLQRQHARFINTGLMATLSGAVVSDGLANGQVISGVGGQYNFVAMAHQLNSPTTGGRSILLVRAVRDKEGKTAEPSSNIVFNYGHCTIPRHLRDIVITEYGIADLRSKTDSEVAKAMLNLADSRFQPALLSEAQRAGKIESGYQIPPRFRDNTPAALELKLGRYRSQGLFPAFPFGTDLTPEEIKLGKALKAVKKAATTTPKWRLALRALRPQAVPESARPYLQRMQLEQPQSLQDKVVRMLLVQALDQT